MISRYELHSVGLDGAKVSELLFPDTPETCSLLDLWIDKCKGDTLPARADFKPQEMRAYLDHLFVTEAMGGGEDFVVRLCGTSLVGLIGLDPTGLAFSDARMAKARWRVKYMRQALEERSPNSFRFHLGSNDCEHEVTETIYMPVCDKGGKECLIFGATVFLGRMNSEGAMLKGLAAS